MEAARLLHPALRAWSQELAHPQPVWLGETAGVGPDAILRLQPPFLPGKSAEDLMHPAWKILVIISCLTSTDSALVALHLPDLPTPPAVDSQEHDSQEHDSQACLVSQSTTSPVICPLKEFLVEALIVLNLQTRALA